MRDLGKMGENTFNLWCTQVGLGCNPSDVDKYGWDFLVEFPLKPSSTPHELHQTTMECKVQVKATDNVDRKLSIKLSNLRRLATAPIPTFFVFIEFDGADAALRAFLVHIDNELITKILHRIHRLESDGKKYLHRHSMSIQYGPEHELPSLNGDALKAMIESYVPGGMSSYVSNKIKHLSRAGYEDGMAQISFSTTGEENLVDLIDVSLGLKPSVQIETFEGSHLRFGIKTNDPSMLSSDVKLEMPDLQPSDTGKIIFKDNKLSPGISFSCRYYYSSLNAAVPKRLVKIRIATEYFDVALHPFTGKANYRFLSDEKTPLELKEFRNVVKLMQMLGASGQPIFCEMISTQQKTISFTLNSSTNSFPYGKVLDALNTASKITEYFELSEPIRVSPAEIYRDADMIDSFILAIAGNPREVKCDFSLEDGILDVSQKTVFIMIGTTRIGRRIFGLIIALIGKVSAHGDGRYKLESDHIMVEQKFVSDDQGLLNRSDVIAAVELIDKRYESEGYQVIVNIDKTQEDEPSPAPPYE